jgi:lysozyme family protein
MTETTALYQLGDDAAFERCLPDTLKEEGPVANDLRNRRNYSNDAHDAGGMTMDGIIQREYDRWRKAMGLPTRWVRNIDPEEVRTIYREEYWLPYCPKLPTGLDLCLFDTNVNNGVHAGTVMLQRALDITADGVFGGETSGAIFKLKADVRSVHLAIARFYQARRAYYLSLRDARYFGSDWLRRDLNIEQEAFAMIAA